MPADEPMIEEMLARMEDLHGDEWEVKIAGGAITVIWDWWGDGDPADTADTEVPRFEAGHKYVTGMPLREALAVATAEWAPIDVFGHGDRSGWCCRLCGHESEARDRPKDEAQASGEYHLLSQCRGRAGWGGEGF